MNIKSFINKGLGNLGYSAFSLILSLSLIDTAYSAPKIIDGDFIINRRQVAGESISSDRKSIDSRVSKRLLRERVEQEIVNYDQSRFEVECIEAAKKIGHEISQISCEPNYVFEVNAKPVDKYARFQYAQQLMQLPEAWDITQGDSSILVAVIDTGVDVAHEDLRNNIWVNSAEVDSNGIDDDGNGLVDDYYGADFTDDHGSGTDDHGHGTHVAGIIAGEGNNGIGITGVAWNVKIMPLKFIGAGGYGSGVNAARAIDYAVANGAKIINASWGAIGANSTIIEDAIKRARDKGVLFVAAAGNDGVDTDKETFYPAGYELSNIISVGATDNNDERGVFSNYGVNSVDISAPGVSVISTYTGVGYSYLSGTSMAAPHVAGIAALLISINPELTPQYLKYTIVESGDLIGSLAGASRNSRRANAYNALLYLASDSNGQTKQTYSISVTPGKSNIKRRIKKIAIERAFNLSIVSSDGLNTGELALNLKIGEYSCNISNISFSGDRLQLSGVIRGHLIGKVQFAVQTNDQEFLSSEVKINSVNSKFINNKKIKPLQINKLSDMKKEGFCKSVSDSITVQN